MTTPLDAAHRKALRARGHALKPVVLLGERGFTEAVAAEIEAALEAHELIKIRLPAMDRDEREALAETIVGSTGAARVQSIGRVVLLYRKRLEPPPASSARNESTRAAPARNAARQPSRRGTRQR